MTSRLVGPWRSTAAEAITDAIRAGQATSTDEGRDYRWIINGAIQRRSVVRHDEIPGPRPPSVHGAFDRCLTK